MNQVDGFDEHIRDEMESEVTFEALSAVTSGSSPEPACASKACLPTTWQLNFLLFATQEWSRGILSNMESRNAHALHCTSTLGIISSAYPTLNVSNHKPGRARRRDMCVEKVNQVGLLDSLEKLGNLEAVREKESTSCVRI